MRKIVRALSIFLLCVFISIDLARADDQLVATSKLPQNFYAFATSSKLANPGVLIVDPSSKTDLYDMNGDQAHTPASVFKLVTTFTSLHVLTAQYKFTTSVFSSDKKETIVIQGSRDPWLTSNISLAKKNGQVYLPGLIMKTDLMKSRKSKTVPIHIEYTGLFENDVKNLSYYFKKNHRKVIFTNLSPEEAQADSTNLIGKAESLPIFDMVKFAILWSDNQLADRLVREAARHENLPTDHFGLQKVVETSLHAYGISTDKLFIVDGAGLDKENAVTPRTIIEVLMEIRNNPLFQAIYQGLPVSGESGTLKNRFNKTGSNAIGLVRAKTGWINSVVSLAGFVTVGNKEYVFAVIADHITPGFKYRNRARETIDSLLGTIAAP